MPDAAPTVRTVTLAAISVPILGVGRCPTPRARPLSMTSQMPWFRSSAPGDARRRSPSSVRTTGNIGSDPRRRAMPDAATATSATWPGTWLFRSSASGDARRRRSPCCRTTSLSYSDPRRRAMPDAAGGLFDHHVVAAPVPILGVGRCPTPPRGHQGTACRFRSKSEQVIPVEK